MPIYCYNLDRFLESIDGLKEKKPDRAVAMGYLSGNYGGVMKMAEQNFKQLADFIFPAEIFADPETLDDIKGARKDLVVTGAIPSKMLATEHKDVLTLDEYRDLVREVASDFDEPVFLIGHFSPGRSYRVMGNGNNEKPRHFASMYFPEAVFASPRNTPLNKMHGGYPGTIVLEAEKLTENALAVARGEVDSLELDEREDDSMDPEEIYETLVGLSPGDRVQINDRDRAMTVTSSEETSRRGFSNAECMFLSGNGIDYRLTLKEDSYGQLDWSSDSEYVTSVEVVEQERQNGRRW